MRFVRYAIGFAISFPADPCLLWRFRQQLRVTAREQGSPDRVHQSGPRSPRRSRTGWRCMLPDGEPAQGLSDPSRHFQSPHFVWSGGEIGFWRWL